MPTIYLNGRYWNQSPTGEDIVKQIADIVTLNTLEDVDITSVQGNDFFVYNGTAGNWKNETALPIKHIKPAQTANQSRPLFELEGDWSHLAPAFGGVDISGSLLLGAADLSAFTTDLPFSAAEIGTPNAHSVFLIGAQNYGSDDGTHSANMILRGANNVIRSSSESGLPTAANVKPLKIEGNRITLWTDNTEGTNTVDVLDTHTEFEKPPQLPSYTTTERDALSPNDGWMILNTTTNKIQARVSGAWVDLH